MKKLLAAIFVVCLAGGVLAQPEAKKSKSTCHHTWIAISYELSFNSIDWTKVHSVETIAKLLHSGTATVSKVMCSKCGEVRDLAEVAIFSGSAIPPLPDAKSTDPTASVKK